MFGPATLVSNFYSHEEILNMTKCVRPRYVMVNHKSLCFFSSIEIESEYENIYKVAQVRLDT